MNPKKASRQGSSAERKISFPIFFNSSAGTVRMVLATALRRSLLRLSRSNFSNGIKLQHRFKRRRDGQPSDLGRIRNRACLAKMNDSMKQLLHEIRRNPLLWLLMFVPIVLVAEKMKPEAHT